MRRHQAREIKQMAYHVYFDGHSSPVGYGMPEGVRECATKEEAADYIKSQIELCGYEVVCIEIDYKDDVVNGIGTDGKLWAVARADSRGPWG